MGHNVSLVVRHGRAPTPPILCFAPPNRLPIPCCTFSGTRVLSLPHTPAHRLSTRPKRDFRVCRCHAHRVLSPPGPFGLLASVASQLTSITCPLRPLHQVQVLHRRMLCPCTVACTPPAHASIQDVGGTILLAEQLSPQCAQRL